ncbi:MAG: alpha/beta hydrolase [Gammaproteobacteria bacterium]
MTDDTGFDDDGTVRLKGRTIPLPATISPEARRFLAIRRPPSEDLPAADDKAGWRALVAKHDAGIAALFKDRPGTPGSIDRATIAGLPAYVGKPAQCAPALQGKLCYSIHGGALLFMGGEMVGLDVQMSMARTRCETWSVDYRMPPDHPYPAALDDCVAVYRAILKDRRPQDVVVTGASAGGNLAAALMLRARDEGLPLPAGLILLTPEVDLTESGDSFETVLHLDNMLTARLMPYNRLYAGDHDPAHPYLSPLFGDFTRGYPPTFLQTGTRDLFLSNTVRMHRALRDAGIDAELHCWEAMPHGGFGGGTPEDAAIGAEVRRFLARIWRAPA